MANLTDTPNDYAADVAAAFGPFRWDDQRECFEGDIARLGADEAARQFAQASAVLDGLCCAAENISVGLLLTLIPNPAVYFRV